MPWVHYVPVKVDYSDLYDSFLFFHGLPDGSIPGQELLGERIAMAGRDWIENFWRHEVCISLSLSDYCIRCLSIQDIAAYTWRMYLEWVRVMSDDRKTMDFVMPPEA
jgi:hypothetical protein